MLKSNKVLYDYSLILTMAHVIGLIYICIVQIIINSVVLITKIIKGEFPLFNNLNDISI